MVKKIKRKPRGITMRTHVKRSKTLLPHVGKLDAPVMIVLDPFVGNTSFKAPMTESNFKWFVNHLAKNGGFKKEDVCIVSACPPVDKETWDLGKAYQRPP